MNIREIRQNEATEAWFNSIQKSMINSCPRFGKIWTAINIMKKGNFNNILCSIPRNSIINSWEEDFKKWGFQPNITYTTHISAKKLKDWKGDLFIIDEPHEASLAQLKELSKIVNNNKTLLLDGTITKKTENKLFQTLGTNICYKYTINQGVQEGILSDYQINIHTVSLDDKIKYISSKKGLISEKERFKNLIWVRNKLEEENKSYSFIDLKIISILQNSKSKEEYTKKLLNNYENQRILVFCGTTNVADNLGISSYHSKTKENQIFLDFCNGIGNHLATIKMMQSGITILPINRGIINYTSGNPEDTAQKICRFLGIEYDNLDKKSVIDIIISDTEFEKERIKTALMFFDDDKIKYINV